jgi:hypothetical protein
MSGRTREGLGSAGISALILMGALLFSCEQAAGPGIPEPGKTPETPEAPEPVRYSAAANGVNGAEDSSLILFTFDEEVADLKAGDISLNGGGDTEGSAAKGALSGSGKEWALGIAVQNAGSVTVAVNKEGIDGGKKLVAVYKAAETIRIGYSAAADGGGDKASSAINFAFGAALEELFAGDIVISDITGSAYPMEIFGGGQEWSLGIVVIQAGTIGVSIDREGIEAGEHIVAVYKPEESSPAAPERIGIAVISPPDTTLYALNQTFDRTGLELGWAYSDGSVEPMPAGSYQLEEPDMGKPVAQRVNVQAGSYKTSFWIQVLNSDKALVSIGVSGPANKIQEFGKEFDRTGLTVTGHYSDGSTSNLNSLATVAGYDKYKRGPQAARVMVNGKTAALEGIVTRIGEGALVSINRYWEDSYNKQLLNYKDIYIKGEAINPRGSNIHLRHWENIYSNMHTLTLDNGGLMEEDFDTLTGYNSYQTGWQAPSITIDGRQITFDVRVMDVEAAVWFDYGYMRHDGDPTGHGPGLGKYYAKPDETLVIAPTRYLVGYHADHSDAGASYSWTVSGDNASRTWTTSKGGELLHLTPKAAGTYTITVDVTGRDFVSGGGITKTAGTELVCYTAPLPAGTFTSPLRNFGPGQFATGGSGYGWSLGSAGGYEVWAVEPQSSYFIDGNPFGTWHEPGVVWMQEDNNGNGLPDEMWHEVRGGDDDDPAWRDYITRRYAVTYFTGNGTVNQLGRPPHYTGTAAAATCWVDSKGRTGILPGGFPSPWGVTGDWVTYTCTLLRDDGDIATGNYNGLSASGYVDTIDTVFPAHKAMRADGTSANLSAVQFIKVQTGIFRYGGLFGDISTEVQEADFLGRQSSFPKP